MRVIVCLDDNGGMFFNYRRQSRDRVLCADAVAMAQGTRLLMSSYSQPLFAQDVPNIVVANDFLDIAQEDDYCFVEDRALSDYAEKISEIVIYRWNKHYPADTYFDLSLDKLSFRLCEKYEFEGSSHEKITKEIYRNDI